MKNYRNQTPAKRCGNCEHGFMRTEHDEYPEWFCNSNNDRPLCCSAEMNELSRYYAQEIEWKKWASSRMIEIYGVCDNYKKEK